MEKPYTKGKIDVGFQEHLTSEEIKNMVENLGLTIKRALRFKNICAIAVPIGSEEEWVKKFQNMPEVRWADLDIIGEVGLRS